MQSHYILVERDQVRIFHFQKGLLVEIEMQFPSTTIEEDVDGSLGDGHAGGGRTFHIDDYIHEDNSSSSESEDDEVVT